jgi:hypothetical protein
MAAMASDKKTRAARVRFALPSRLGEMHAEAWTQEAPDNAVRRSLQVIL